MTEATKKEAALRDLENGGRLTDIAIRYGVSVSLVSVWREDAGMVQRKRGCPVKTTPSPIDLEIVKAVKAGHAAPDGQPTVETVRRQFGFTSRSAVHRIYQKWKDWEPGPPPFAKGDTVRWMGRDYLVLEPDTFTGKVQDIKTGTHTIISWRLPYGSGKRRKTYRAILV